MPYWLVDASFSVMLLLLAATAEGLGALFFRLHRDPGPLLERLGVPYGREVVGAVALGYEAAPDARAAGPGKGSQARRARRALDEMIQREAGERGPNEAVLQSRHRCAQGRPALTSPVK